MEAACREPTFVENHDTCMANNHGVTEYETIPVHQHLYIPPLIRKYHLSIWNLSHTLVSKSCQLQP